MRGPDKTRYSEEASVDARKEWTDNRLHHSGEEHAETWLLGQPPLQDYLSYVRKTVIGGADLQEAKLVNEWRAANDHYHRLEASEGGIADQAEIRDLDPALRPLARKVARSAAYRRAFHVLPTRFAVIELDRLVVSQPHVNLAHADRLMARLGASPTPEALFGFCLPIERPSARVQMRRAGSRRFFFYSESSDLRFHEAAILDPKMMRGYESFGPLAGVIGLAVGLGSNFLNVIQSDTRLLLHNGHHRAYALRALGITHAPCIVQTVTRRDELNLVASRDVAEAPAFYFKAARPPLLKDFFDPKIRKVLRVPKTLRVVELSFESKDFEIKDFAFEDPLHADR